MNDFVEQIAALSPEKRELLEVFLQEEGSAFNTFPLSFGQERLWFLHQIDPSDPIYNIPATMVLQGPLDLAALQHSLNAIIARHEVLRTTFVAGMGQPRQVIAATLTLALPMVDLLALDAAAREAATLRLAAEAAWRPFDLGRGPLVRALALRLGAQHHVLLLTLHHIIVDGWSLGVLVRELAVLYRACVRGQVASLPALPLQYADFAVWQRGWLRGAVLEQQLAYWRRQLSGALPILELPTDRPRAPAGSFRGARQTLELSQQRTAALHAFSGREGVTLFMTLLAAFNVLLARYSRQDDILVGSSVANRSRAETKELIGFFVNTLVLRADLSGDPPFRTLLARVRAMALGAYAHQDLPFEQLVKALQPERELSRTPFFQVGFAFQTMFVTRALAGDLTIELTGIEQGIADLDVYMALVDTGRGIVGTLDYNADLFDATTIERMFGHFQTLLDGIVADPGKRLSALPLLSEGERRQLLVDWNTAAPPLALPVCCAHELFEAQVTRAPDAIAMVFADQELTYTELNRRANRLAHALWALGVGPERRVGLCVERSPDMLVGVLGVLKVGGAFVPLDPAFPQERKAFILADTQVPVLLSQQRLLATLPPYAGQIVCFDADQAMIARQSEANPPLRTTIDNLAYVMYTSGSTGLPKGVLVEHRGLSNLANVQAHIFGVGPGSRVLQLASLASDAMMWEVLFTLPAGAALHIAPEDSRLPGPGLMRLLREQAITAAAFTPAMLAVLPQLSLPALHILIVAGEVCSADIVQRWAAGRRFFNGYGPTEITVGTAIAECVIDTEKPSIGRPFANTQIYILDASLCPVPIGVSGELYIGGIGVARGYLNRPDLTAERFVPNPFATDTETGRPGDRETGRPGDTETGDTSHHSAFCILHSAFATRLYRTGDLARYRADGNIEFIGRIDQQVKIRGFRVELEEIETVLGRHAAVRECVILVREDVPGDKRLVAYVVLRTEWKGLSGVEAATLSSSVLSPQSSVLTALRSFLAEQLPSYMVPAAFVFLEQIPRTATDKRDRRALPAPDQTRPELEGSFVAARTPVEELIAGIWAEVFRFEQVGVHDNFFDLGGHSLLATQVISRVRAAFKVDVPLRALFESPTVGGLARSVNEACRIAQDSQPALQLASRDGALPLSFAQQRLWFLHQLDPDSPTYNIPAAALLQGPLDLAALQHSLNAIIARHEVLRTTFVAGMGQPRQLIASALTLMLPALDLRAHTPAAQQQAVEHYSIHEAGRPFDLERGPLVRALVLQLDMQRHVLLLTLHHIIADGWSLGVLVRELAALYPAYVRGQAASLPALPLQYADFAVWQRGWLRGAVLEQQLAYWRRQLSGVLPILELPTDRPRPPIQTFQGRTRSFLLPPALSEALKTLSRREDVTLFMTLLAAFDVLLARYSQQDDILVGSPVANRSRVEIEELIGFFVNTLVLRADLSGNPPFYALLAQVRAMTLGAYAHQDLPFEQLVDQLHPKRDPSRTPLFQVMFALQNAPLPPLEFAGVTLRPLHVSHETAKFDLFLSLMDTEQGLEGQLEYSTDLFDAATIERMIGHFQTLLDGIVADPGRRLFALPLLSEAEQRQLLTWNAIDSGVRSQGSEVRSEQAGLDRRASTSWLVHELFEAQVARTPDAVALIYESPTTNVEPRRQGDKETGSGDTEQQLSPQSSVLSPECLTYRELNRRANRLAHALGALGAGPEVRVGLCVERSPAMLVGALGVLKAGGAYVPLDPVYPKERLAFMLTDSQALVLLTQRRLLTQLPATQAKVVCLDTDWGPANLPDGDTPASGVLAANLAYVIYTSGSTGAPKGVQIPHSAVVNFLRSMRERPGLNDRDTLFAVTTLSFDIAALEIYLPLMVGARVVIASRDVVVDGARLGAALASSRATVMQATPATWRLLLKAGWRADQRFKMLCGGEALSYDLAGALLETGASDLWNLYGPTETTIWSAIDKVVGRAERGTVPLGAPIANTQIAVLDRYLQLLPIGVAGELYIGGDGLARGYLGRPDLTAERFIPNPFFQDRETGRHGDIENEGETATQSSVLSPQSSTRLYKTGDLGRYRPDGTIEFLGRVDHQVKLRGHRIELLEIEAVLGKHPTVREAVVVMHADAADDKRLVAYVVQNTEFLEVADHAAEIELQAERIAQWGKVFNEIYCEPAQLKDTLFNITGWNSSYTGAPLPEAEMREWVDGAVTRILALRPRRVLEIGCGTGLLLFRIAPHCDAYCGTDLATVGLNYIREQIAIAGRLAPQVTLLHRAADNFDGIMPDSVDTVILNSVVQYFPSIDYLLSVLQGAARVLAPGGAIFVGDVRSLPLLRAFHVATQMYQAAASLTKAKLQQQVQKRMSQEEELIVDPAFFTALSHALPRCCAVQLQLKRGHHHNEMTRFRYDVVIQMDRQPQSTIADQSRDWRRDGLTLPEVRRLLVETGPEVVRITDIPDARLWTAIKALEWLASDGGPETVGEWQEQASNRAGGVDPESIWAIADELPYTVELFWSVSGADGCYDAVFHRRQERETAQATIAHTIAAPKPWHQYANMPLLGKLIRKLTPMLRSYLKEQLPEYMVPSAFVLLDALPLTPNGKVDRRALPGPDGLRPELITAYVAPKTEVERTIAVVWQEVLQVENVGVQDNFFELGGHSLLMAQVLSKLREAFDCDISMVEMFQYPTVSAMAKYLTREHVTAPSFQHREERAEGRRESLLRQKHVRQKNRATRK